MVQTIANAIERGRIAHAFLLTGVRGVGKTSTARLIAKALNCVGPDGQGGPTIHPCGVCEPCKAIAEGRHIDVIEMDAASHTGVDDVREIIEAVRYSAVSARFKIYIIDEVHMLSKNAFNALLKTLEEPPEHVKFLFATTEVDKVPVTVLSRCQRFDLRRIPADKLAAHFAKVAESEAVNEPGTVRSNSNFASDEPSNAGLRCAYFGFASEALRESRMAVTYASLLRSTINSPFALGSPHSLSAVRFARLSNSETCACSASDKPALAARKSLLLLRCVATTILQLRWRTNSSAPK
jgi:DNA polymerase-3 subunit gamma/tau